MRSWFSSRAPAGPAPATGEAAVAYRADPSDAARGERLSRRDRRAAARAAAPRRRRGAPILSLVVLIIVAFGAVMIYLAARNGSFAGGGAVIDRDLSSASEPVRRPEDRATVRSARLLGWFGALGPRDARLDGQGLARKAGGRCLESPTFRTSISGWRTPPPWRPPALG
jgi:hypothetical protein